MDYSKLFIDINNAYHSNTLYGIINTNKIVFFEKWYSTNGIKLKDFLHYIGDGCHMVKYDNQLYLIHYHYDINFIDNQIIRSEPYIDVYTLCEWKIENDNGFICLKEIGRKLLV